MITLYGIKNCDIMQKAMKWLDAKKLPYMFHDYKTQGIDHGTLERWLDHVPANKLINLKSTTYRSLADAERAAITNRPLAMELMLKHNSIIKRPVWDFGNDVYFPGWDETALEQLLNSNCM